MQREEARALAPCRLSEPVALALGVLRLLALPEQDQRAAELCCLCAESHLGF